MIFPRQIERNAFETKSCRRVSSKSRIFPSLLYLSTVVLMPSPQPQEEIAPSSDHTLAGPSQNGPRSIYSFWGNGAGPSNPPPPPPVQLPPKRKRKKAHEASSQAKLALNGSNGATSAVRKGEQGETEGVVSSTSKGKRRAIRSGGEEEEMKEMAKKAKQLEAEAKKAALKRARKSAENSVPGDQGKSNGKIFRGRL